MLDVPLAKEKVNAGAEHLVSQLFFNNNYFYNFLDKARSKGIDVPVEAGIIQNFLNSVVKISNQIYLLHLL